MIRTLALLSFVVFLWTTPGMCVGKTSVITLVFPVGAENCGLGESGVSLAENVFSVFWNPASLPAVGDRNSVQLLYARFYEPILPAFGITDLWHADTLEAVFLSNVADHFDVGFAHHINFLNFGENTWTDDLGNELGKAESFEVVETFAMGLRYRDMVSIGLSVKDFDSRLAPGFGPEGDGTAQGQVLDFGLRLEKRFRIADILDIHPAFGFAVHSFPQDSTDYIQNDTTDTVSNADPLPLERWYGGSIAADLLGLFGVTYVKERSYSVVEHEFIDHEGYKVKITPFFAILRGSMEDPAGQRSEESEGFVFRFNFQEVLDVTVRSMSLFNSELADKVGGINDLFAKYHLRPNFFFEHAESEIFEPGQTELVRTGQKREDNTVDKLTLRDVFRKREKEEAPERQLPENVIEEEDGELVQ